LELKHRFEETEQDLNHTRLEIAKRPLKISWSAKRRGTDEKGETEGTKMNVTQAGKGGKAVVTPFHGPLLEKARMGCIVENKAGGTTLGLKKKNENKKKAASRV